MIVHGGIIYAQPGDGIAGQVDLDEVVVISSKETGLLGKSPIAASVFSARKLHLEDIKTSKNLTALVPNLFMPDYGSKINSPIYIRGIGSKVNSPSVGLYIDNMPYFEKCTYDVDLSDVQKLEVLRGPQGTLYGRNTMGGIINIYTRSPFDYQGTRINLSSEGNYGNYSGKVSNFSRLSDVLGLSVSATYTHKDGYFTNIYRDEAADKMDDAGGRVKLSYKPVPALLIELTGNLTYSNQQGYPYAQADSQYHAKAITYNEKSGYRQSVSTGGLLVRHTTGKMIMTSVTSYQWFRDKQAIDQDFTSDSVYFVTQRLRQNMISEEFTIRSESGSNYQWVVGVFGFIQGLQNQVDMDYRKQKYSTEKDYDHDTKGAAIYHQSTLRRLFTDGLSVDAGIRLDYETASMDYDAYKINTAGSNLYEEFNSGLDFYEFLPKINLMYTVYSGHRLYLSVAKGYKTGGFNTTFEREEDRTFDPEQSWNYELGYKLSLSDRLQGEFCFFYIDWKNQQINVVNPSGVSAHLENAGRSESRGFEASVNARPVNNLSVDFQYGYTRAVFLENKRDDKNDYSGNYIPYIPRNTVATTVNYTIPCQKDWLDKIVLMGQYNGVGSLYWEESNKNQQDFYGLLNARVTLYKGLQSLSIWGRNLLNTYYNSYLFSMGVQNYCQQGRPFTFGIDLTINL